MKPLTPSNLPFYQRLTLGITETTQVLGVGRNTVYGLIKAGKLKSVKFGSRNMVTTDSIRAVLQMEAA
jgi:excisionase family DNA binding protein